MEAKNCHERVLSRIFHVSLTTGIVLILVLKDTGNVDDDLYVIVISWFVGKCQEFDNITCVSELRRACFNGNWFYVAAFLSLCFIGFIFYFVASCMDPGFAEISDEKSIMVTFEVRSISVKSSQHEHKAYTINLLLNSGAVDRII